jgi:hypothetical protein
MDLVEGRRCQKGEIISIVCALVSLGLRREKCGTTLVRVGLVAERAAMARDHEFFRQGLATVTTLGWRTLSVHTGQDIRWNSLPSSAQLCTDHHRLPHGHTHWLLLSAVSTTDAVMLAIIPG